MKKTLIALSAAAALALASCHSVNDERIPYSPVRIPFSTQPMWETYGVNGALDYQRFIRDDGIPQDFPFTSLTYTGFGGVLLCGDIHGNPVAYDLACPVERSKTVRIIIDMDAANAYCPKCQSVYDVFSNYGSPLAGEAARLGYALRRYSVGAGLQGEYRVISN